MLRIPWRSTAAAGTALFLAAAVTACSGGHTTNASGGSATSGGAAYALSAATPVAKGPIDSFSWALYAEPTTLDYAQAFDYPQNMILSNICESLMRWNPDLTESPGLASSVAQPDPTTYVYTLRSGVKFHDGGTMTADDVVFSLKRQMDPATGSTWISTFDNVASITKTGALQVTVKLKKPDSQFGEAMANSAGTVVHASAVQAAGQNYGTAGNLGCTGPYTLGTWVKGTSIELDRFPGYWGKPALAGKVVFKFITDPTALTNALLTGAADGGYLITPDSYARLKSSGVGNLYFGKSLTTINLNVCNLSGTLGDVRVRKALLLALDRSGFVKAGLKGVGTVTSSIAPADSWPAGAVPPATDLAPTSQDLTQAKALIQQAGATGKTVTIATSPIGPDVSLLATAFQSAGTQIGLKVQLKTIAPDAFTALFSDPKAREGLDAFPETYYLSTTDPLAIYHIFGTGDFENYAGWSDPAYDKLIDQAEAEYDPVKRAAISARIQKIAMDQLLWIPAAEWPTSLFLDKRITGAPTSISYLYYPWAADVGSAG
ncbi:ABC transporter substrate-binding protein [Catenulispora pinisilvae]|uniref:ABC transporter substrate-binding protein n=1 Tax=Catenulispora pinisilvae TaxID=2705253 RepID=UPI001E33E819|nr:ABC transporter substrate-binding protein [Catenulispora pinisilvae]